MKKNRPKSQLPLYAEILVQVLLNTNKEKQMKSDLLLKNINVLCFQNNLEMINPTKVRTIVNYCRKKSIAPIISTPYGYFISYNTADIKNCAKSLYSRGLEIMETSQGLLDIMKSKTFSE